MSYLHTLIVKKSALLRLELGLVASLCAVLTPSGVLSADDRPTAGRQYAVLVGVEAYLHARLREPEPLRYAVEDVTELAEVLSSGGYEVVLLTDDTGKQDDELQPTKSNIEAQLAAVLRKCGERDTVIVAFAGHGLQFAGQPDAYFCPMDARPFSSETETLVSVTHVYNELEKSFAGVKAILFDACRNDPDPGRGRGVDADSSPAPPRGVAALFSCSAGQRAFEHDDLQHGVFFYYVLEGLRGTAAKGGTITFEGLSQHVREHVPQRVTTLFPMRQQQPNMKADLVGRPPVLVRVRGVPPSEFIKFEVLLQKRVRKEVEARLAGLERAYPQSLAPAALRVQWIASMNNDDDHQSGNYYRNEAAGIALDAYARDPEDAWANYALGLYFRMQGEPEKALQKLEVAISRAPNYADPAITKVWILCEELQRTEEGIRFAEELTNRFPDDFRVFNALGTRLFNDGRYEEGLKSLERALKLEPGSSMLWNNKGYGLSFLGRRQEEEAAYARAIELAPQSAWQLTVQSVNLERAGRPTEALRLADMAIAADDYYWGGYDQKARILMQQEKYREAMDVLSAGITIKPAIKLHQARGSCQFSLKNYRAAFLDSIAIERIGGDAGQYGELRALAHVGLEEWQDGLECINACIAARSDDELLVGAYELRAGIYRRLNMPELARSDEQTAERLKQSVGQ